MACLHGRILAVRHIPPMITLIELFKTKGFALQFMLLGVCLKNKVSLDKKDWTVMQYRNFENIKYCVWNYHIHHLIIIFLLLGHIILIDSILPMRTNCSHVIYQFYSIHAHDFLPLVWLFMPPLLHADIILFTTSITSNSHPLH